MIAAFYSVFLQLAPDMMDERSRSRGGGASAGLGLRLAGIRRAPCPNLRRVASAMTVRNNLPHAANDGPAFAVNGRPQRRLGWLSLRLKESTWGD